MIQAQSPWNSLEVTKLVVDILTPLFLLFLGIWVNRIAKRVEAAQWTNQKVIEKRIAIYDELAPFINDLYCFYMCVGNWKELKPTDIVNIKRKLDKRIYIYAPLFSPKFLGDYNEFIGLCFQSFVGYGHDARLRTLIKHPVGGDRRESSTEPWRSDWDALFTDKEIATLSEVRAGYENLMTQFADELGIGIRPSNSTKNGNQKTSS
jgi:hypothetical protein